MPLVEIPLKSKKSRTLNTQVFFPSVKKVNHKMSYLLLCEQLFDLEAEYDNISDLSERLKNFSFEFMILHDTVQVGVIKLQYTS